MVGLLTFTAPASRAQAERCLVSFVRGFRDVFGENPDAFGLDASVSDGIHAHFLWAGHSLTRAERAAVKSLWPWGLVCLSRIHASSADLAGDREAYAASMEGSQSWSMAGSKPGTNSRVS